MKIKIERNWLDTVTEAVSLVCLVGVVVFLALVWNNLPDQLPAHYNFAGEVTRWGSKNIVLFLPALSWVIFGMISLIERFPQVWNTGVRVTDANRTQVYRVLKNLIQVVKALVVAVFAYLTVITALQISLPPWFLLAFLLVLFFSIMRCFASLFRISRESAE